MCFFLRRQKYKIFFKLPQSYPTFLEKIIAVAEVAHNEA